MTGSTWIGSFHVLQTSHKAIPGGSHDKPSGWTIQSVLPEVPWYRASHDAFL